MDLRLKELIEEATEALSRLDTERLAELALSCEALNRDPENRCDLKACEATQAAPAMDVFSRVLGATRANLEFMTRLSKPRGEQLEYRLPSERGWNSEWNSHGNH